MNKNNNDPLANLKGSKLSAVTFVQDYIQLQFDGPVLTAITTPRVQRNNESFEWGMPDYRNAICEQIGKLVRQAFTIEGREIKIEFEDSSSITVSLRPEDYRVAEAAVFECPPNPTVVW